MLRQVATPSGDAAPAEPEGLLIPLCPECGSYYIYEVDEGPPDGYVRAAGSGASLYLELGRLYTCLPCGWIGNRPRHGL
jgi:predicted RNA-binding Zn-ribbon protein involved in translation (DUF1610 family)